MAGAGGSVTVAINLMRMALALLNKAGEDIAAIRLQPAIDAAFKVEPSPGKRTRPLIKTARAPPNIKRDPIGPWERQRHGVTANSPRAQSHDTAKADIPLGRPALSRRLRGVKHDDSPRTTDGFARRMRV